MGLATQHIHTKISNRILIEFEKNLILFGHNIFRPDRGRRQSDIDHGLGEKIRQLEKEITLDEKIAQCDRSLQSFD